ncbi:nitronate monooxygenase, partial [Psychrobacter sp. SIMBA_152]
MAATVSNFGGLGSLGSGMTAPNVLTSQIDIIKSLTDRPFMINLMVLSEYESSTFDTATPAWLSEYYQDNNIEFTLPECP